MDVPSFLCLETSPAIKYLLLKKRKYHTNDIFKDREKYGEFHTLFHQLLEQEEDFFSYMRMTKSNFYYILENIREKIQKQSNFRRCISPEERLMVTLRYVYYLY